MSVLTLDKPITATEQLVAQLYRTEGKAEIINGEIIKFMSTGDAPSSAAFNIAVSLKSYQRETKSGRAYTDNVGFIVNLPNRKSFSPDVSFYIGERTGMKFLQGAPVFAFEVRSENDYGTRAEENIKQKRRDYFAAGTKVVWDVDLLSDEVIKSYSFDNMDNPKVFRRGEIASADSALPSWEIAVDELFD